MSIYIIGLSGDEFCILCGPFADRTEAQSVLPRAKAFAESRGWTEMTVGISEVGEASAGEARWHDEILSFDPTQPVTVYENRYYTIECVRRGDGRTWYPLTTAGAPGAVIVPRLSDGRIVLLHHYRGACDQVLLELPRGGSHPGEIAADTALREVEEETGRHPDRRTLKRLGAVLGDSAIIARPVEVFEVEVSDDIGNPDGEAEAFTIVSLADLSDLVRAGQVIDGFTLGAYALLRAAGER